MILYIAFGILTTIVNLGSFYVMNSILQWNENISNFIAILLAVIFAYITNKDLVFHSEADSFKEKNNRIWQIHVRKSIYNGSRICRRINII